MGSSSEASLIALFSETGGGGAEVALRSRLHEVEVADGDVVITSYSIHYTKLYEAERLIAEERPPETTAYTDPVPASDRHS